MSELKIGFIGLGLMGGPMAKNILKKGFSLSVYNRTPAKAAEFKKLGAEVFNSPSELAKNVDVVVSMVTGPKDVRNVLLGRNGAALTAKEGAVFIDMSTIGPTAAGRIGDDLKELKINFIDAPVTGSTDRAKSGELVIFAGGDKKVLDKVMPVLQAMGTEIHHMGKIGSGQAIKLVNNLIGGETIAVLGEAFLLGEALGLSKRAIMEDLKNTFSISPNMKNKMPMIVEGKYPVMFSVANMRKDLKLGLTEKASGTSLPLLKTTESIYKKTIDQGFADEDIAATFKIISRK